MYEWLDWAAQPSCTRQSVIVLDSTHFVGSQMAQNQYTEAEISGTSPL